MAAICVEWLRRKVSHPCEGEADRLIMYLRHARLSDFETELQQFATNRGAPHSGLSMVIRWIRAQIRIDWWPTICRSGHPTPVTSKTGTVPPQQGLGSYATVRGHHAPGGRERPSPVRSSRVIAAFDSIGAYAMATLMVRNLGEDVVRRLRMRAAEHGRSAEAERREILRFALIGDDTQ
jgi:hypothetical protein